MKHVDLGAVLAVVLALTSCSRQATEPVPAEGPDVAAQASPSAAAPGKRVEYHFPLLTRAGAPVEDPRIVSTDQDHPCGPVDLVRVSSIPMDDPVFVPAYVVEFDAAGKEIRKWGVPNEAEVVALEGDRLQFRSEAGRFWVTPQGMLEEVTGPARAPDLRTAEGMFDCPALLTFGASDAAQCFRVADAAGVERRIAMEGTCS